MAQSSVPITAGSGTAIDVFQTTGTGNNRQSIVVADPTTDAAASKVQNGVPGASDYGLTIRQVGLPAAAALANVTANPTLTQIQTFPMVYDSIENAWDRAPGDITNGAWVNIRSSVSLTVTATLSQFPATATLADNTANPTLTQVQVFSMVYDSGEAAWDRMLGDSSSGVWVQVKSAIGYQTPGAPVPSQAGYIGGIAKTGLPGSNADGQLTGLMTDQFGRLVAVLGTVRTLVGTQTTTISGSTTETTIVTAIAGGRNDLMMLVVSNTSASTNSRVDFRDTTGGPVLFSLESIGGANPIGFSLGGAAIPQSGQNTNWTATTITSTSDIRIYAVYAKNK